MPLSQLDVADMLDMVERRRREFAGMPSPRPGYADQTPYESIQTNQPVRELPTEGRSMSPETAGLNQPEVDQFPAMTQLRKKLDWGAPTTEQYRPSKLTRAAAIASGLSAGIQQGGGAGAATADTILRTPYRHALEQYNQEVQNLQSSAGIEGDLYNRETQAHNQAFRNWATMSNIGMQGQRLGLAQDTLNENRDWHTQRIKVDQQREANAEAIASQNKAYQTGTLENQRTRNAAYEKGIEGSIASSNRRTDVLQQRANQANNKSKAPSIKDQETIEKLAMSKVRLTKPDLFNKFVKLDPTTKKLSIVGPDQSTSSWPWGRGVSDVTKDTQDYQEFQQELQSAREDIMNTSGMGDHSSDYADEDVEFLGEE